MNLPDADLPLPGGLHATPHRFLWHSPTRTAILADLHLGLEIQLRAAGIFMPDDAPAILPPWSALLARAPQRIVIAGDFFDHPAPAPETIAHARALLHQLPADCPVTLTRGNHDPSPTALREIFATSSVETCDSTRLGPWLIAHGDNLTFLKSPARLPPGVTGLIVGHQHPAVLLADRVQSAKMICYALCQIPFPEIHPRSPFSLLLLPAFSRTSLGSNLLTPRHWILDLPLPADKDVHIAGIVGDRVLDFGPLDALRP